MSVFRRGPAASPYWPHCAVNFFHGRPSAFAAARASASTPGAQPAYTPVIPGRIRGSMAWIRRKSPPSQGCASGR